MNQGCPKKFTHRLTALCQQQGVTFLFNTAIKRLIYHNQHIDGVEVMSVDSKDNAALPAQSQILSADAYVLALGSYSPAFVKDFGYQSTHLSCQRLFSHVPVLRPDETPYVSLIDDEFKLVYSRLGDRLRVAGTAEFNGFNLELNPCSLPSDYAAGERCLGMR